MFKNQDIKTVENKQISRTYTLGEAMVVVNKQGPELYSIDGVLQKDGEPWALLEEKVEALLEEKNSGGWTAPVTAINQQIQEFKVGDFVEINGEKDALLFAEETVGSPFGRLWIGGNNKRFYFSNRPLINANFGTAFKSGRVNSVSINGVEFPDYCAERFDGIINDYTFYLDFRSDGTFLVFSKKREGVLEDSITSGFLTLVNSIILGFNENMFDQGIEVYQEEQAEEEELTQRDLSQPIKAITGSRQEFKISDFTGAVDVNHASNFAKNVVGSEQGGFLVTGTVARYGLLSAPMLEQMGYGLEFTSNWGLQKVTSLNGVKIDRNYVNTLDGIISTYDFNIEFRADGVFFTFCRKGDTSLEDAAVDTAFLDLVNDLFLSFNEGEFNESDESSPVVEYNDMGELSREIESIMESEGAVLATLYTTSEEGIFTPQNSKHVYHFSVGSEPSTLEYYLSEETLTGKDGFALLEEYHGNGAYREVVEIENIPTYVQEVFGGTYITEEAYEDMLTLIAV